MVRVVAQSVSRGPLFATPWTAAHQAPLSSTISRSLLKFVSIGLVMPSNHLILCHPFLLLPSIFLSIRIFSSESALRIRWPKYWSFSFRVSLVLRKANLVVDYRLGTLKVKIKSDQSCSPFYLLCSQERKERKPRSSFFLFNAAVSPRT